LEEQSQVHLLCGRWQQREPYPINSPQKKLVDWGR